MTACRLAVLVLLSLVVPAAAAGAPATVSIFFYPWYGTPRFDGEYQHWGQRGASPPGGIASAFYPARGVYSSSDTLVLAAQMSEIRGAGVDQVVSSWWGRGSREDARLPAVLAAAAGAGLEVAAHLEPYLGRTPESAAGDVEYLERLGIREFYVYAAVEFPAERWAAATGRLAGVDLFAQTARARFAARGLFSGLYTYDILVYGGDKLARLCGQARRLRLDCAPSVGPGYDARRASGDPRVKPRRDGATYDSMWRAAVRSLADRVTVTSYNEWHEGTQIEPARPHLGPRGGLYLGYDGAWGRYGAAARRAYLDRTAFWSARFAATRPHS